MWQKAFCKLMGEVQKVFLPHAGFFIKFAYSVWNIHIAAQSACGAPYQETTKKVILTTLNYT